MCLVTYWTAVPVTSVPIRAALHSEVWGDRIVSRTRIRLGNRAFCIAGPTACNSLPSDIRTASTLPTFKNRLNTHLFLQLHFVAWLLSIRAAFALCSDFTDMLRLLINCRFIIRYKFSYLLTSNTNTPSQNSVSVSIPTWHVGQVTSVFGGLDNLFTHSLQKVWPHDNSSGRHAATLPCLFVSERNAYPKHCLSTCSYKGYVAKQGYQHCSTEI